MHILDFLTYALALGIAAAIPGPGIAACVGKALGAGFRPALIFVTGLVLGDLTYLTFSVFGLAAVAHAFEGVFLAVRYLGAAYLVYLAWHFWTAGITPEKLQTQKGKGGWAALAGGYALTLGNPKTIIFYVALLPTVVDVHAVTLQGYLGLAVATVLVLYAVVIPYIALASRARRMLSNPKALKAMNRTAATAIGGAAGYIIARG